MKRIDLWLIELGLAPSRTKAKELILSGHVEVLAASGNFERCSAPSKEFKNLNSESVRVQSTELLKYVARSGLKLEGALRHLKLNISGFRCLDVGQSTGGFTDCLLSFGARQVVGVDVGKGQLSKKIKNDLRVISFEGLNAKDLTDQSEELERESFDLVVADVSFISLTKIINPIWTRVKVGGLGVFLVKPQFELEKSNLNKKGVVLDESLFHQVENKICQHFASCGIDVENYFSSPLPGADGNKEFFVYAKK